MKDASSTYQKFVILTSPRTGSNYLSYLLHDHPNMMSIGEVYCLETLWGQPGKAQYNHNIFLRVIRNLFPLLFLKRFVYHQYPKQIQAVGFRLFYHQADHFPSLLRYLIATDNLKVIHLQRLNLLENLVSLRLAQKTKLWSSMQKPSFGNIKLTLSYQECLEHFIETTKTQQRFSRLFPERPVLPVYYERLYTQPQKESSKILAFLGLSQRHLTCALIKQNTRPLDDVIQNYQELKRRFSTSSWYRFFQ